MWYSIENAESISTPCLAVHRERVCQNIAAMVSLAGDAKRLCPHVKTHKMADVTRLYLAAGVRQFKCATIAEAEMVACCGADFVLLAHQPVGPNIQRFVQLRRMYPQTEFATIVDELSVARRLAAVVAETETPITVFLDLDVGMHRTGIAAGPAAERLYEQISELGGLRAGGLHLYDGHIHDADPAAREAHVEECFRPASHLRERLVARGMDVPKTIAGGTPSFPIHAKHLDRLPSPGTCVFSDAGYAQGFPDMDFQPAAVLLTRVISKPGVGRVCLDLGHKAVAAENPPPRVQFLNLEDAREVGHSEEHLVLETQHAGELSVGDLLYALPRHICPTVALHQEVQVVGEGRVVGVWEVTARNRRISI